MFYRTSTAVFITIIALIAWGLVGYFALTINTDEEKRVSDARDAQLMVIKNAHAIRTHALALDTVAESSKLETLLDVDVVSVSYLLEEVGRISGVTIRLGNAQSEMAATTGNLTPKTIGFTITAEGKFAALIRAAQLFETLPIPSSVSRLDIERTPSSSNKASDVWHMNVHIRVLTTSNISS